MRKILNSFLPRTSAILLLTVGGLSAGPSTRAGVPGDLTLEFVVGGFARPVTVRHAGDGSGRLFVVEQAGRIRIYDTNTETLLPTPFLDISSIVDDSANEQGLLGLDFHPNYASNGFFYVNYTRDPGPGLDRTVVARYKVSTGNPDVADAGSASVLLEVEQDFSNHNGGDIHFGPDGYLHIGMGDGGSGGDPLARAQDLGQLLGKMLRIDVDGTPPATPNDLCGLVTNYGIPATNPFAGGSGECDEIWAYGLRNPWRWSFDRTTGDLLIGDVGQNAIEEVDFQPAASSGGENYGWSCKEGNNTPNFNPCLPGPLVDPIFTYSHSFGCSITGGYRYRGPITGLDGTYITGDYCSGRIWFGEETSPGSWSFSEWQDTTRNISSFGEDENGNVYLTDFSTNAVYVFSAPPSLPAGSVPGVGQDALLIGRSGNFLTLSWGDSCAATDTDYEIYEASLVQGGTFDSYVPRQCSTSENQSVTFPQGIGSRYYIVVPRNQTTEGSYGLKSNGEERPASSSACLDQVIDDCL